MTATYRVLIADKIAADLKDGVLTVIVPKLPGNGPRKVDVG